MNTLQRLVAIARPYAGRLLLVAVLTSMGALGELIEPWVYRAIVNDIVGVFVSRATGLLPEILEELRGGEAETEPEAGGPGPASAGSTGEGAVSTVDFKTEAAVKQTLRELTRSRTTLIIAHRQSMLTEVDRVVALRDGRVVEDGSPQALFERHGYFFQMMTAQPHGPELHVG
jgi:ABC-type multidrug transport system fused ATPase/permease subunit